MTAVISACVKKKNIKVVEFSCSRLNIEDGRKYATFWYLRLYYFKKGKNTMEMQRKICAVCGEGAVTDRTCQQWFAKVLGATAMLAK